MLAEVGSAWCSRQDAQTGHDVLIEAHAATKRFGRQVALDCFNLTVSAGEIVGLVGHNGAGKTTFARAVAGLVDLDSGDISVDGLDVSQHSRQSRQLVGLAPQELALYPTATAMENLLVFAGLYGVQRLDALRRIDELAEAMVLNEVLHRRVRDLSGGQQRRLQAATAMIHRPIVLLLDEPTVGADPITREALLAVVRSAASNGAAVVYTTHYLPELDALEATVAVADHGRVIARGRRAELLATLPGHAVLDFDGDVPPLDHALRDIAELHLDFGRMIITAPDPAAALAALLASNPDMAHQLRSIEMQPPTLDDLYRHLVVHGHD
jgi:ABC-2 type transport system ATP-binding protein